MSNFSTYFPIPSSGGGGGIPINGYFPFIVSSTGIPTGYDSTTGLYTHPDGTFWVKTGNTVLGQPSDYPNATGPTLFTSPLNFSAASQGMDFRSTGWTGGTNVWALDFASDAAYEYTSAGVYTGTSFSTNNETGEPTSLVSDGSFYYLQGSNKIFKYTTAGVYTGTSFDLSTLIDYFGYFDLTYDGTNLWAQSINKTAYEITTSGVYTGNNFTASELTQAANGLTWDGTHFWASSNARIMYQYTSAGVYTGLSYSSLNSSPSGLTSTQDGSFYVASRQGANQIFEWVNNAVFGDSTARTDTDSAQPLFVRIG